MPTTDHLANRQWFRRCSRHVLVIASRLASSLAGPVRGWARRVELSASFDLAAPTRRLAVE